MVRAEPTCLYAQFQTRWLKFVDDVEFFADIRAPKCIGATPAALRLNSLSIYFADTMRRAAGGHSIERRHLAIDRLDDALHFLFARRNGIEGFACFL
ncbi:MAG TPA: hypothetical protein VEK81_02930, partial [Burkholderiales bacterium]|nr:hypothetical protein [Burkholderiales bacterium]